MCNIRGSDQNRNTVKQPFFEDDIKKNEMVYDPFNTVVLAV